jgi:hypothetical protein
VYSCEENSSTQGRPLSTSSGGFGGCGGLTIEFSDTAIAQNQKIEKKIKKKKRKKKARKGYH